MLVLYFNTIFFFLSLSLCNMQTNYKGAGNKQHYTSLVINHLVPEDRDISFQNLKLGFLNSA